MCHKNKTRPKGRFYFWWRHRDSLGTNACAAFVSAQTSLYSFSLTHCRTLRCFATLVGFSSCATKIKHTQKGVFIFGGGTGTRTLDPLIKSQLLYQLSYASMNSYSGVRGEFCHTKNKKSRNFYIFSKKSWIRTSNHGLNWKTKCCC